jgi:DNA-binding SARP family transcriptional activator
VTAMVAPVTAAWDDTRSVRVELCGTLAAEIDGRRIDGLLSGQKGRLLFACLVINRQRPMSRDELIEVLWPVVSPVDPEGALSTLLTRLRVAIGRDLLRGRSELTLLLGDDAWVDWDVAHRSAPSAEQQLATGDARGALELALHALQIASRPLLPSVSSPWLEDCQRQLHETYAALLETAGRAALQLGGDHLPTAERAGRGLIASEPYRESGYRLLMETHIRRGNVAEALRVYDDVRRVLREELGLTPAKELTALASRLLEHDAPEPAALLPPLSRGIPSALEAMVTVPLSGRRDELAALMREVLDAPARRRVLALCGEGGIGKTRLAAEVAVLASGDGVDVLYGRAERNGVMPFQPVVEALRAHLSHGAEIASELLPVLRPELEAVARVVPELRPALSGPPPNAGELDVPRFCLGAGALLDALAKRRPVLLVLEDLQWADRQTLVLLRQIARGGRITVLTTLRDDGPTPADLRGTLTDLMRERALTRIVLRELDESATAELVSAHGVSAGPADIRALRAHAGGNPLYLEELVTDATGDPLPHALREAVETRLEPLPRDARDALAAGAASGPTFDLAAVAGVTGQSTMALAAALAHAQRAGLVVRDEQAGDRFAFRHGIVRHALLS